MRKPWIKTLLSFAFVAVLLVGYRRENYTVMYDYAGGFGRFQCFGFRSPDTRPTHKPLKIYIAKRLRMGKHSFAHLTTFLPSGMAVTIVADQGSMSAIEMKS